MDADWSVACGADDPVVVVPWGGEVRDTATGKPIEYIDLCSAPDAIREVPEAVEYPDLGAALRRWNQPETSLFTAKCDVWNYPAKFFDAEDLPGFACAHASYIDLLPTDPKIFASFAACEQLLRIWTNISRSIPLPASRCEFTLRPARILPSDSRIPAAAGVQFSTLDGFATSLYVWGYGSSPESAASAWSQALLALVGPIATHSEFSASKL
ncbi:MAG: hypothetical protein ABI076_12440 [Acidobacteriaceae bacterium]